MVFLQRDDSYLCVLHQFNTIANLGLSSKSYTCFDARLIDWLIEIVYLPDFIDYILID